MATCDLGYEHGDSVPVAEPEPPVIVDQGPNENAVKIAEIEAAARVETEKIWTEQRAIDLETNVNELRGQVKGMREILDRVAPPDPPPAEPPAPVIVKAEGAGEDVPPPPETGKTAPKSGGGFWDGYATS